MDSFHKMQICILYKWYSISTFDSQWQIEFNIKSAIWSKLKKEAYFFIYNICGKEGGNLTIITIKYIFLLTTEKRQIPHLEDGLFMDFGWILSSVNYSSELQHCIMSTLFESKKLSVFRSQQCVCIPYRIPPMKQVIDFT